METKMKVLVYRDRTRTNENNKKKKAKNSKENLTAKVEKISHAVRLFQKKIVTTAAIIVAVIVAVTGTAVVYADMSSSEESEIMSQEMNKYTDTCTAYEEALAASERAAEQLANSVVVLRRADVADAQIDEEETIDIFLMEDDLMSEGYMAGTYIPVNMGVDDTDDVKGKMPSKEELIESRLAEAVKKAETPSKLTYSFNQKMVLDLPEAEINVLERIVEAEAGDQDIYGRMLVANVILNRVNDSHFPDTVKEVVYQQSKNVYQFSPVRSGSINRVEVSAKTKEAVSRVLAGEDYSKGAEYFFMRSATSKKKASWFDSSLEFILKYGCHEFYKDK